MAPRHRPTRRTAAVAVGVASSLLLALVAGSGATAGEPSAREQRAQVRAEQAQVAARVDALQGDQAEVAAALATLDENVRGQQAALADAQRAVEASTAQAAAAEAAMAEAAAEIEELRAAVVSQAVEAYIRPPDEDFLRRLRATNAQEDASRRALMEMRAGEQLDSVDGLKAAQQRFDDERARAEEARGRAERAAAEAQGALASLDAAKAEQEAFAGQVRARLESSLAEAAHLSQVDADLSRQVQAEQAALAALVAAKSTPSASASASGAAGSSPKTPSSGSPSTSARARVPRPALATVGSITVAASIAPQLRALVAAASSDGIFFSGYGYRDVNVQIALRAQNCGGWSESVLYDVEPSSCSPPTARPGSSLHEQGLAVDFSIDGEFIESRSSEAYQWLAANAATYGFHNLPSEPWHWSTTGG